MAASNTPLTAAYANGALVKCTKYVTGMPNGGVPEGKAPAPHPPPHRPERDPGGIK